MAFTGLPVPCRGKEKSSSRWEPIRAKKPRRYGYQEQEPGECHVLYWALCFQKDINQVAESIVAAGIQPRLVVHPVCARQSTRLLHAQFYSVCTAGCL